MKRLINLGFVKVGEWHNNDGGINHSISKFLNEKDLLYAFVVEEQVMYVGKTASTLRSRMNGYKNAAISQRTNIRVKSEILKVLNVGNVVQIFTLLDNANLVFENYKVSLSAGLEDNLIAAIRPKWNYRGNNRIKEQELPPEDANVILEAIQPIANIVKSVEIKLGQEYWNNGFFNFSKKDVEFLPQKPTSVTLLLGPENEFQIQGHFLFATKDGQPRLRGNKSLKQWFQDNYCMGDIIKVDIISPEMYRIN